MPDEAVVSQPSRERPAGFLALMRNRNYALLWSGQLVSEMGNRFHWVAVSLWVYKITQSPQAVSLAISSMFVGSLLVSFWAGPIIDRFNRRAILIVTDIIRAVLVFLIPSLVSIDIRLVYLDLVLISIATAFFRPAIYALLPEIVPKTNILPANSFFTAMDTATEIVGPVLAGIVAQRSGYAPLLYADSFTYIISALCVAGIASPHVLASVTRLSPKSVWDEAIAGLTYLRRDALQWTMFILIFPAAIVGSGLNALQTPLAKGAVGITDAEFGVYQGIWGVGFVTASLLLGWFAGGISRVAILLSGFYLAFTATAAMGLSRGFELLLATAFVVGFGNTLYFVGTSTLLMEYTPQTVIGRVLSIRQLGISVMRVISPLFFGAVAEVIGVREAVVGMAFAGVVGTSLVVIARLGAFGLGPSAPAGARTVPSLWRVATGRVNPELDEVQQRALSFIVLCVALAGWIFLLVRAPTAGLLFIAAGFVVWIVGRFVRIAGWRA